jgi:hypothetical protein
LQPKRNLDPKLTVILEWIRVRPCSKTEVRCNLLEMITDDWRKRRRIKNIPALVFLVILAVLWGYMLLSGDPLSILP